MIGRPDGGEGGVDRENEGKESEGPFEIFNRSGEINEAGAEKEGEPDDGQRELEVGRIGATEGDNGVIREENDDGERVEKSGEEFFHRG